MVSILTHMVMSSYIFESVQRVFANLHLDNCKTIITMTKNYNLLHLKSHLRLLAMGVFALVSTSAYAQLSGTKTLGTGGDYTTWADLATAISSNGVNGNLTINVTSNLTSTKSITLVNNATNPTSATQKITIDGKGFKLTSNHDTAALVLNGIDYVTLKDYTIDQGTTLSRAKGIQLMNGADYNTIDKCTIFFSAMNTANTSISTGGAYVVISNSFTALSSASSTYAGSYNTIQNKVFESKDATKKFVNLVASAIYKEIREQVGV